VLRRVDIRAPRSGMVHELAVHTVGGVLTPGETAMLIVPDLDALIIEAGVPTIEIDRIHVGQSAAVRFPAFNARVTPQLDAHVTSVSPDTVEDRDRGTAHYVVKLALDPGQLELLGKRTLIPGMPVEVFIKTGDRQVLSYLIKPITDQLDRAFREE